LPLDAVDELADFFAGMFVAEQAPDAMHKEPAAV
jgi:hypothetical protein